MQYRLLHYRTGFFNKLRAVCAANGMELHLVHGQATRRELERKDEGKLDWADKVENKVWEVGELDLIWQPYPAHLRNADLVVVMQESRILSNYHLLLKRMFGGPKVAFWGHGVNFKSKVPNGLKERWKHLILTRVDGWLAYTQITADVVKAAGYPSERITCLNNTIDTVDFRQDLAAVTNDQVAKESAELKIADGSPVGIFCGSLYPDKRLDFLVEAADRIQEESPDFHLLVVGDGPSMSFMRNMAATRSWMHLLGVKKGVEKALYFRMADFMLNPGLVGLHIVDGFCAGLVILTTSSARHSPEIAYLQQGVNGFMTPDCTEKYAQTVLRLIQDQAALASLKAAALADAEFYTLDKMVENFAHFIKKCLALPRKKKEIKRK